MNITAILGQILMVLLVLLGFRWYYEYRRGLNKKKKLANLEKKDFKKPTVLNDAKKGVLWLVVFILGALAFLVFYNVLHFLFPYWFPDGGFR